MEIVRLFVSNYGSGAYWLKNIWKYGKVYGEYLCRIHKGDPGFLSLTGKQHTLRGSPCVTCKESTCKAGDARDMGSIPGLRRSPGRGHGKSLQDSCLENPHEQKNLADYSPEGRKRVGHDWSNLACKHILYLVFKNPRNYRVYIKIHTTTNAHIQNV